MPGCAASVSFLETICLQDWLLCSSLNTTRGPACQGSTLQPSCPTQSHAVVRKKKKSWKTLSQRASLGLFHFLHRCGGDSCVSLMLGFPPVPLCASSNVPDWYGRSNDASLSTGIYEHRNKPVLLTIVVGTHSSWKFSCTINTGDNGAHWKEEHSGVVVK